MKWTWSWLPVDAGTSFGDNLVFDWVRVGCMVSGVVLLFVVARILVEARRRPTRMPATQVARFVALAAAVLYIGFTEFAVLGTAATPRLFVGIVALGAGVYGAWGMRRKQRAIPPVQ